MALWVATVMVALFGFFPNYLGVFLGGATASLGIPDNLDQASLSIEGMTCKACAASIQESLGKIDGIDYVRINFDKGSAVIGVPKDRKIPRQALLKTVEEAGYKTNFDKNP